MTLDLTAWLGAPRMGAPVTGFLALKAPIDFATAFGDDGTPPDEEHEFNVTMFMERQASDGRPVGLVVDLTSPQPSGRKLYDTDEWTNDWDVQYFSLPCTPPLPETLLDPDDDSAWVEPVPSEAIVDDFIKAVERFWANPANRKQHVAVHCVTGVNIAGYLIMRFLTRTAPVGPTLAAFAKSRPPGIYSPDVLEAIWSQQAALQASGKRPASADGGWVQPQPPSWHPLKYRAVDRTAGAASAAAAKSSDEGPSMAPPPAKRPATTTTMAPPPPMSSGGAGDGPLAMRTVGTRLAGPEAIAIWMSCDDLIRGNADSTAPFTERQSSTMPGVGGLHGVPLVKATLEGMRDAKGEGWLVTWKADSARCLLAVGQSESYLFDRHGSVYRLPKMHWPKAAAAEGGSGSGGGVHTHLILAGEIVCDKEGTNETWRLLCYDLLVLDRKSLISMPLHKRLALLNQQVLDPRKTPAATEHVQKEKLRVRAKDCFRLKHTAHLLRKFIPKLSHPAKGLVFLKSNEPLDVSGAASTSAFEWLKVGEGVAEAELLAFADAHFV